MVRQAYDYRLALGRSAFELPVWPNGRRPQDNSTADSGHDRTTDRNTSSSGYRQSYNARGHPQNSASRALIRRNARAHNEVLATVHVCAQVDGEGKDVGKVQRNGKATLDKKPNPTIVQENETGVWISMAEDVACLVATAFTVNIRQRIETFSRYERLSLMQVSRAEFSGFGFFKFFLAGKFASTTFYGLTTIADALIEMGRDYLVERFASIDQLNQERNGFRPWIDILAQALKIASFSFLSPLKFFATLQRLDLLPAWPLLPTLPQWLSFTPLLPPFPTQWNRLTFSAFATALAASPFVTFMCMHYFADKVAGKLCSYSRASIPRPDNPDSASYRVGVDDGVSGITSVLGYPKFQGTLRQELQKDIEHMLEGLTIIHHRLRSNFRRLFDRRRQSVSFPRASQPGQRAGPAHENHQNSPAPELTTSVEVESAGTVTTIFPPAAPPESSTATSISPPLTPTSSEDWETAQEEPSNVRIRTRTGSTSTLHMDVEFNSPGRDRPSVTSSFAASPRPAALEAALHGAHKPHYRVTALTLHASDSLGSHVVNALMSLLFLPLESLYVRSVARSFLTVGSLDRRSWMLGHTYPLQHWILPGFHDVGWRVFGDYAAKLLLCVASEAIISTGVWRLACRYAEWTGRSWYSWGKL